MVLGIGLAGCLIFTILNFEDKRKMAKQRNVFIALMKEAMLNFVYFGNG